MTLPLADEVLNSVVAEFASALPSAAVGTTLPSLGAASLPHITSTEIPKCSDLHAVPARIYRQINSLLKAGKQHLIFFGPPGTGKTTLAEHVANHLSNTDEYEFITGASNIDADYLVGGYQPVGDGKVEFRPGLILRQRDVPMVIDEMNRCEIDAALGPLFSVLNGKSTTLPLLARPADKDSPVVSIEPGKPTDREAGVYGLGDDWRLIATMNTIDRTALNQLSYALSRRFGWVYVGVPDDLQDFLFYLASQIGLPVPPAGALVQSPIAAVWSVVNEMRPLGGAPFKDLLLLVKEIDASANLFQTPATDELKEILVDGLHSLVAPLLGGLASEDVDKIIKAVSDNFSIALPQASLRDFSRTLRDSQV